jgi:hypothetical protein
MGIPNSEFLIRRAFRPAQRALPILDNLVGPGSEVAIGSQPDSGSAHRCPHDSGSPQLATHRIDPRHRVYDDYQAIGRGDHPRHQRQQSVIRRQRTPISLKRSISKRFNNLVQ